MIDYYQEGYQFWKTLFRVHGSSLYRSVIPVLCSTGFLFFLYWISKEPTSVDSWILVDSWFVDPEPIVSMMVAFTFLLTFKCSFSYNRYWESCNAVYEMHSKWLDVAMQLAAFHLQSERYSDIVPPAFGRHPRINHVVRKRHRLPVTPKDIEDMIKDEKVKHKRKSQRRRSFLDTEYNRYLRQRSINDPNANSEGNSLGAGLFSTPPISSSSESFSDSSRNGRGKRPPLQRLRSDTDLTGGMGDQPGPSLFLQETSHLFSLLSAVAFATLRETMETAESPLHHYVPGSPWPPVDPDEKVARDEIDKKTASECFPALRYTLFGQRSPRQRTKYNACRPLGVLGGVTDAEIEVLRRARGPLAKTALCSMWVEEFITREYLNGSLGKVESPIVSFLYQFLSEGMNGYNQARKVAYVPFPFPHFQLTKFLLVIVSGVMPVLMLAYVHQIMVAAILNTVTVGCFFGLWIVARVLEDPFRNEPNDIPLNNFQAQFNEALLCMFAGYHPESWWEIEEDEPQAGST